MDWEETDTGEDWLDSIEDDGVIHRGAAAINIYSTRPNSQHSYLSTTTLQPISNRNQNFTTHLRPQENLSTSKTTGNRDRVSVEQVIDPTTRMVFFKLLNHAIFDDLDGCIFTRKHANVYHATKHDGQEFAVKVFKDRDYNIQGDYLSRHGNCKRNPRKMVKTWAENEMRNLMRLKAAGIRCPTPIVLRLHVLVMEFIGKSGAPAPCLKDANLSEDKMPECYVQMIIVMRNLYQKCKLVHGDLSEYNILYYEGTLHIIDVSQSVDLDHPLALELLYGDCIHVSDFFRNNGVEVISPRNLFDFIVDSSIPDESVGCYLEESDIPRYTRDQSCSGVRYIPTDHDLLPKQPKLSDTIEFSTKLTYKLGTESETDENEVEDDDSSDSKEVEPYDTTKEGTQKTLAADKKAARKENKKKVKEEKREARKTKTAKYVKKKKNKMSKNIKAG